MYSTTSSASTTAPHTLKPTMIRPGASLKDGEGTGAMEADGVTVLVSMTVITLWGRAPLEEVRSSSWRAPRRVDGCETPLGSWADEGFTPNAVSVAVGTTSDSVLLNVVELSVGCPGDVALTSIGFEGCCVVLVYVVSATRPVQYLCNKATACRTSVLTMYRGHNRRPHYAHRGPQCLTRETGAIWRVSMTNTMDEWE